MEKIKKEDEKLLKELNSENDHMYQFVMLYYNYIISKHDYGNQDPLSMVEAHTITYIEEHPGTTASELSNYWKKSKGAISQTISKLVMKGYVRKEQSTENAKVYLLYCTDLGVELSLAHKAFDLQDIKRTRELLRKTCTEEEIEIFFKVIKQYLEVMKDDYELQNS